MSIDLVGTLGELIYRIFQMGSQKVDVPLDYQGRVSKIKDLLANDYTGIISTILDYQVSCGTVDYKFESNSETLNNILNNNWKKNVNANINIDIQRGLRSVTRDYMLERVTTSFIALNWTWEKQGTFELPGKMWISDATNMTVEGGGTFGNYKYFLDQNKTKPLPLAGTECIIRKPFASSYSKEPVPYLIKRGTLYHALIKKIILEKQARGIEEVLPYLMILKAGNDMLAQQSKMSDIEEKLTKLKESFIEAQNDKLTSGRKGKTIFKGRYDTTIEHLIPEFRKFFDPDITAGTDKNLFSSLGLVELQGFGDTRQEAILNPKVLVEEINDAVKDLGELYQEVLYKILERNKIEHRNLTNNEVRVLPGVIKSTLTKDMLTMIQKYSQTGILGIESTFEGMPLGFDFKTEKIRQEREAEDGSRDIFVPRPILNQDNQDFPDVPNTRVPSPQETPQNSEEINQERTKDKKKKKKKNYYGEYLEAPYKNNESLPEPIKVLPDHAMTIWRKVFNSIIENTGDEDKARRGAWSQVKKQYFKDSDGTWKKRQDANIDNFFIDVTESCEE